MIVLMLLTSLLACANGDGDAESDIGDGAVSTNEGGYNVGDAVGTRDYGGKVVTIGHCGHEQYVGEISQDCITGDAVKDSIYKRNVTVEERLNIDINNHTCSGGAWGAVNQIRIDAESGECSFQIVYSPMYITSNLNKEGMYYDLNECEDIDFTKEYWGEYANEALEIGGIRHNATGALCLNFYEYVMATVVNTRILNENSMGEIPDLFKVVEDGKWTLEYQTQLACDFYTDNGKEGKDEDDIAGFYGVAGGIFCDPYLSSGEVPLFKKDSSGYLAVNANNMEKLSRVADAVIALYTCEGAIMRSSQNSDVHPGQTFAAGKAFMTTLRFYDIRAYFGTITDKYIILPVPKLSDAQEGYKSYLHDGATSVAIPVTAPEEDVQMLGAVLEVLASEGYRQVAPVYYETVLKMRYTSDPRNLEVLDDIMMNVVMDPLTPYGSTLKVGGNGPIAYWRNVVGAAVNDGTNIFGSTFSAEYIVQLNTVLNNASGLNTAYKEMNAGD